MKVVINTCYGGFGVSNKALKMIAERKGTQLYFYKKKYIHHGKAYYTKVDENNNTYYVIAYTKNHGDSPEDIPDNEMYFDNELSRTDKDLVAVVEKLGIEANTVFSNLKIVDIPNDVEYEIEEYNGMESIHEKRRV